MCNVSGRISHDVNSVFKLTICCSKGIPSLCARQLSHDQVRQVDITVTNTIFVWDIEFQSGTSFDLYGFYSCTLSQKDVHQTMVGVVYESYTTYWFFKPFVKQVRKKPQGCMIPFIDDDAPLWIHILIEEEYKLVEI